VGDFFYVNVLLSSNILEICARRGCVTRIIDCSALVAAAGPRHVEHTLNGIAYNHRDRTFLLAGKCWPTMFEAVFPPPLLTGQSGNTPTPDVLRR
jgi:glutamine cyclotransferase